MPGPEHFYSSHENASGDDHQLEPEKDKARRVSESRLLCHPDTDGNADGGQGHACDPGPSGDSHRRVILFFWPIRASSENQTSILSLSIAFSRAIVSRHAGKLF